MGVSESSPIVALSLTSELSLESASEDSLAFSVSSIELSESSSTVALSLSPDPPPEAEQDTREPTEPILNPPIAIF